MAKTKFCAGISDFSDTYMGFIIDQWGVLHDGQSLFDGAIDCLKEMRERKKKIILLSNSPLRAEHSKADLKKMGLGPSLYDHIVTSGEMIWSGLQKQDTDIFKKIGSRCFLIGREDQREMVKESGVGFVEDIGRADFVLIGEALPAGKSFLDYEDVIRESVKRRLKALCVNPDSRALLSPGYLTGPGLVIRRYEDSGGIVHYIGKPHRPIFRHCIDLLQKYEIYPSQTVVVGDTMAHDILGGFASGMDTCLAKSGLHMANFAACEGPRDVNHALKVLIAQYNNVMPTYLIESFSWGRALPDRKHKKRKQPAR